MNIGQVLETHLGWAAATLGMKIASMDPGLEDKFREGGYDFKTYGMPKQDAAGLHMATPVFDGATEHEVFKTLKMAGLPAEGKSILYDGRTGEPFDNPVTVGYVYMLKLAHLG